MSEKDMDKVVYGGMFLGWLGLFAVGFWVDGIEGAIAMGIGLPIPLMFLAGVVLGAIGSLIGGRPKGGTTSLGYYYPRRGKSAEDDYEGFGSQSGW